jgi:flagellar basal-body rod protein FlgC
MDVDNIFGPIDIAVSGMRSQSRNIEVISSNVANARTSDAGKGQPYRRLETIFETQSDGISPVTIGDIITDMSNFQKIFDPGNPYADESGYVAMPNVKLPIEMMNLTIATRAYQANAAILKRYQQMVENTLELLR